MRSFFLAIESFKFTISLGLFARLFNEIPDSITTKHFFRVKNLIKVSFKLFSSFFNVFRTVICDPKDLLFRKRRSIMSKKLQILNFAVKKSFMNISQLAVSSFESPLFPRVKVTQSNVVNHNILN